MKKPPRKKRLSQSIRSTAPSAPVAARSIRWWTRGRSAIHRHGLFAARDIPRGTRVIEYVGTRVSKAEGWRRAIAWQAKAEGTGDGAVYVFELNKRHDIDGRVPQNTARHINHSCAPNCEPRVIRGHIWIIARRHIPAGSELTYDYGYNLENWEDHPCRCGTLDCPGFIAGREYRKKLRGLIAQRNQSAAVGE